MNILLSKKSVIFTNLIIFIISFIHFFIVYNMLPAYDICNEVSQKLVFFSVKTISFIMIFAFWQIIAKGIFAIINMDKTKLNFLYWFLGFFLLNILILYYTFPFFVTERPFTDGYYALLKWEIYNWPSYFQTANFVINYNIIPSFIGVSIVNDFIYSLFFAYIMTHMQGKYSNKLYLILLLPFCFPFIIAMNQMPQRFIFSGWLLVFIFAFILFNQQKENAKVLISIFFAFICAIAVIFRHEYLPLMGFLPILVWLLKIFNKRNFVIYTIVLLLSFTGLYYIENLNNKNYYEVHNTSFVYDEYIVNNFYDSDIEKNKNILNKVYEDSLKNNGLPSSSYSYNIENKQEATMVYRLLMKFAIKKSPYFIKTNIKNISPYHCTDFQVKNFLNTLIESTQNDNIDIPEEIRTQKDLNTKITSFLLTFNFDFSENPIVNIIYHPLTGLFILIFFLVYSIVKRNSFYFFLSLSWFSIMFITLIFMHWNVTLYFWAFFFNTRVFFFILLIDIINSFLNKKKIEQT